MSQSQAGAKTPTPALPDTKSKSKRIRKIAALLISTVVCMSIFFGADFYLHYRLGVNLWGYRGQSVGRKQPGEKRVAVVGGSTTWGYGLAPGQDFPAQLQRQLTGANATQTGPVNLLNLGYNNEGAYSFTYTLSDYDYLNYDAVLLYSGYNDLGGPNVEVFRHRSPVFRWTGYLPLLPILAADKLSQWQKTSSGKNEKIVFQPPNLNQPDQASRLQEQIANLNGSTSPGSQSTAATCPAEWQFYCERIYEATDLALRKGKRVLIVGEPYITDKHVAQQTALENMLRARFANQPHVRYLNLGRAIDLRDRSLCWDGMHLTEAGNRRIAEALSTPVLELLKE
jgi:lysophospholipase L1-like esterase